MESLIAATVVIGDRGYRIKVRPEDEEVVRKTVKLINDKILEYRTQFAGKDMQDYIAMVLAWYATEQNSSVATEVEKDNIQEQLTTMEKLLDSQLNNA